MGQRRGEYEADFPVGAVVRIADRSSLEQFRAAWRHHHPLAPEQLEFSGREARVREVGFYHGGDELYTLEGVPGLWHEQCLTEIPKPGAA